MTNEEQLKEIAAQLRQPSGEKGIEVAYMMNETNIGMTLNAISNLQLTEGDHILEPGHGNCAHLADVLSRAEGLTYQGLEMSELMLQEAERLNQQYTQQASFTLYNGLDIPFDDNTFNKAFTVNTLYFWQEPGKFLAELHRVLKPGGRLAITFAHRSFMEQLPFTGYGFKLYNPDEAEALVRDTPFTIAALDTQTEQVRNKMGDMMDRAFSTFLLQKYSGL